MAWGSWEQLFQEWGLLGAKHFKTAQDFDKQELKLVLSFRF